jgi:hypothetical protein
MFNRWNTWKYICLVFVVLFCNASGSQTFAQNGGISGRVTFIDGGPLGWTVVSATELGTYMPYELPAIRITFTDTNGGYSFENLPAGWYKIQISAAPLNYIDGTTNIEVFADAMNSNVDFVLQVGGLFTGTVRNALAEPLSNVTVAAYNANGDGSRSGVTATDGTYQVVGLPSGTYRARAIAYGANYLSAWYEGIPYDGLPVPTNAMRIDVAAGSVTGPVDFVLAAGGIISGSVKDDQGLLLSNATVAVFDTNRQYVATASTDNSGIYAVVALPSGKYYASVSANGANYLSTWYDGIPYEDYSVPTNATGIDVVAGSVTGPVDFVLVTGGTLNGSVRDDQGVLLSNATVVVFDANRQYVVSAATDTNGDYAVVALRTGLYYVKAACSERNLVSMWFHGVPATGWDVQTNAQAVSVTAGQSTTNVDFQLPEGAVVEGVVRARAGGSPLSGISISASFGSGGSTLGSVVTDSNGQYVVQGLTTGRYQLQVSASDQNYLDQEAVLDVIQGTTRSNVNFKLDEGGIILGRVTSADGAPLSGVSISCYPYSSGILYSSIIVYPPEVFAKWRFGGIVTDTNGEYYISCLRTATYSVHPYLAAGNYICRTKNVSVTAGETTVADFELAAGATISGKATGPGEAPVEGVSIRIVNTNGGWLASRQTTSNGEYLVTGLESGHYFVQSCPQNANLISEWFDDVADFATQPPSNATEIVLGAGEVVSNVDFELTVGGIIAGKVTTVDASPLNGVTVEAYGTNGVYRGSIGTSTDGTYVIMGLMGGVYWVRAIENRELNVFGEWYDNAADEAFWPTNAVAVPVSAGMATSNIDFSLEGGGVIAVRVVDTNSNGVTGVSMWIQPDLYQSPPVYIHILAGLTDSNGCFSQGAWETGWYTVTAEAKSVGCSVVATSVYITALSTAKVDFVLQCLPADPSPFDVSLLSPWALQWDVTFGAEYQVEQSTDLMTWSNAADGDAMDETSWRLGGTGGFLEYHPPRGIANRLFLRVKLMNP